MPNALRVSLAIGAAAALAALAGWARSTRPPEPARAIAPVADPVPVSRPAAANATLRTKKADARRSGP